ncbi:MAG: hypothetical protein DSY81_09240 [Bacillota bacterium]|jgi:hypothetical protein|nr:MAG: hypothetical protein DSY92_01585 [Planctomycetota bacterium]RUA08435.1 MAG: hypothetical protein DSY81_09240 [Bacillota bacterium]
MRGVGWGRQEPVRDTADPTIFDPSSEIDQWFFSTLGSCQQNNYDRDRDPFEFSSSVQILTMVVRKSLY